MSSSKKESRVSIWRRSNFRSAPWQCFLAAGSEQTGNSILYAKFNYI